MHRLALLAVVVLAALIGRAHAAESSPDQSSPDVRFLEGLRARGQFWLARQYCLHRLAEPGIDERARADLVIELSRTAADWAVQSPPDERAPLWEQAIRSAEEFAAAQPRHPGLLLVRFQGALAALARGELAREEADLTRSAEATQAAQTALREAIRLLSDIGQDLQKNLAERSRPGAGTDPEALSADALNGLAYRVEYELARGLRNQGQSYPPGSADRTSALSQAVERLDPLADLEPAHPLAWKARLDEIACRRELGDLTTARQKLAALVALSPPADILARAAAEEILVALANPSVDEAIRLADAERAGASASPWLDDARLEAYLAAAEAATQARDAQKAAGWIARATETAEAMERRHGPYWSRRAGMRLARAVGSAAGSADVAVLVRAAENAYRGGRPNDALAAYDRAAQEADQAGDAAKAFDLGYTAAAIESQRGRHAEAVVRFRRLALGQPENPRAPDAHHLALYHAGQAAKNQTHDVAESITLADEHLARWPESPHADQVRWLLGRLQEYRRDWARAVDAYRGISTDALEFSEAIGRASVAYRNLLQSLAGAGQDTAPAAREAAAWLESIAMPDGRPPEIWSPVARQAVLAAAELRLNYTPDGYARSRECLSAAIESRDVPQEWRSEAEALLVFSLAGQGQRADASAVLSNLATASPEKLLVLVEGLQRIAGTARPEARAELAQLSLQAVGLLQPRRSELAPALQQRLDRLHAEILAETGRNEEALTVYGALAQAQPRDAAVQEAYAALLGARSDRASLDAALVKWRELAAGSPRGSSRYFRAKYEVARLHHVLGDDARARTIVEQLAILYPELGGPAQKARFDALRGQLGPK